MVLTLRAHCLHDISHKQLPPTAPSSQQPTAVPPPLTGVLVITVAPTALARHLRGSTAAAVAVANDATAATQHYKQQHLQQQQQQHGARRAQQAAACSRATLAAACNAVLNVVGCAVERSTLAGGVTYGVTLTPAQAALAIDAVKSTPLAALQLSAGCVANPRIAQLSFATVGSVTPLLPDSTLPPAAAPSAPGTNNSGGTSSGGSGSSSSSHVWKQLWPFLLALLLLGLFCLWCIGMYGVVIAARKEKALQAAKRASVRRRRRSSSHSSEHSDSYSSRRGSSGRRTRDESDWRRTRASATVPRRHRRARSSSRQQDSGNGNGTAAAAATTTAAAVPAASGFGDDADVWYSWEQAAASLHTSDHSDSNNATPTVVPAAR
jgi:hypothetical protein